MIGTQGAAWETKRRPKRGPEGWSEPVLWDIPKNSYFPTPRLSTSGSTAWKIHMFLLNVSFWETLGKFLGPFFTELLVFLAWIFSVQIGWFKKIGCLRCWTVACLSKILLLTCRSFWNCALPAFLLLPFFVSFCFKKFLWGRFRWAVADHFLFLSWPRSYFFKW